MDAKILELTRLDQRYSYEAYEFVCQAVTYTQGLLVHQPGYHLSHEDESETHVCGADLLRGACDLAIREFGMMAAVVFRQWGLHSTDDFGEMVFQLIRVERLSKSDRDDLDDFRDVFDMQKALTEGFALTLGEVPRRSER